MKLGTLLKDAGLECECSGTLDVEVTGIAYDSRKVKKGDVFFALKGQNMDGTLYASGAVKSGAAAVIAEKATDSGAIEVVVKDSKIALAKISAAFYKHPLKELLLAGVTGTNGKTTTTYIMESILKSAGHTPGVIGTVNYRYCGETFDAPHTTPLSPELQKLFRDMADAKVTHCVMEVSSHSVEEKRVAACSFGVKMFTNLTPEHLDYHKTMENYFAAKAAFFTSFEFGHGRSIINLDDEWGVKLKGMVEDSWGYSLKKGKAEIYPENYSVTSDGIRAELATPKFSLDIESVLTAEHNLYNIMCAAGAAVALGIGKAHIEEGIRNLKNVPGRLERVLPESGLWAYVDYAHTPDAIERTLKTLRALTDERKARLITVFGCGGNRDKTKRPKMGELSARLSDLTIVTSDNPRDEDAVSIIKEIEGGMGEAKKFNAVESVSGRGYIIEPDRKEAIIKAIKLAKKGDTVLVAGKGHEDYQIVNGKKRHFDDREILAEAIKRGFAS